jgi:hypothetical protein
VDRSIDFAALRPPALVSDFASICYDPLILSGSIRRVSGEIMPSPRRDYAQILEGIMPSLQRDYSRAWKGIRPVLETITPSSERNYAQSGAAPSLRASPNVLLLFPILFSFHN